MTIQELAAQEFAAKKEKSALLYLERLMRDIERSKTFIRREEESIKTSQNLIDSFDFEKYEYHPQDF